MGNCLACGGLLLRVHRTLVQRFYYQAVHQCKTCGRQSGYWYLFLLGRRSHCPRCWNFKLQKFSTVDNIETMYRNPVSYVQKWFGANIYCCSFCRLQFYDLRGRHEFANRTPGRRTPIGEHEPSMTVELSLLTGAIGVAGDTTPNLRPARELADQDSK